MQGDWLGLLFIPGQNDKHSRNLPYAVSTLSWERLRELRSRLVQDGISLLGASLPCAATNRISFLVCHAANNAKENWGFWFQEERLAIWPRLPVVLEPGRYRPFNFDNISKQRDLNGKSKALAKAFGDAIRQVGVPPARRAAPPELAGIGIKDSR